MIRHRKLNESRNTTIKDLIKMLEKIEKKHGDLEVCVCTTDDGQYGAPVSHAETVYYSDQGGEYEYVTDDTFGDPDEDEMESIDGKAVFIRF